MGVNAPPDSHEDPADDGPVDADVLSSLEPAIREWWIDTFGKYVEENGGYFTPPQREAIPAIRDGENVLIAAPTGSGKTLASFTAIIDELYRRERTDGLENAVYCLYVSPLKSLANDIHRNLEVPLREIHEWMAADGDVAENGEDENDGGVSRIRHAIRHGDTEDRERQAMLEETPHILNTTPETLA
ncbi:MAG: DEAD/DEAH box helicase, partial [Halanaeroarchaeum sp.]